MFLTRPRTAPSAALPLPDISQKELDEIRSEFHNLPPDVRQLFFWMMSNETESDQSIEPPSIEMMLLHHFLIIFLTLVGNSLLVYVIMKNNRMARRKRVTPVQMLMLHMCAADLLFALITMIPTMAITATVPTFHGPNFLCKTVKFLQVIPMYASSFLLVAISADRYQAICNPLASMKRSAYNRPSLYASFAWTAAILFSTPQIVLFEKSDGDCMGTYTSAYQYALYVTVFNSVVWLLPSAIAGYLYFCVCQAVWQSTSVASFRFRGDSRKDKKEREKFIPHTLSGLQIHHKGGTMQCVELDRRRVQTVKLTLTIVAANFCLWAPFCITSVIDALWPTAIDPKVATYIMFFGNLNSCMNPWIWFYFNRSQLRRAMPCYKRSENFLSGVHLQTAASSFRGASAIFPDAEDNSKQRYRKESLTKSHSCTLNAMPIRIGSTKNQKEQKIRRTSSNRSLKRSPLLAPCNL